MLGVALIVSAGVLGACSFQISGTRDDAARADDGPHATTWLDGFSHRKPIDLAASNTSTLDDFVVAIAFPDDADLAARARPDGRDLAVTFDDGTTIVDFELERFDAASGALAAWARLPSFAGAQRLYLYYGGGPEDRANSVATWAPTTFTSVWHLTDASPGEARDSTAGGHHLASVAMNEVPGTVDGMPGAARLYDGSDDRLLIADPPDGSLDHGTRSFSYSAWVWCDASVGQYDMPLYKGGASAGNPGYDLELGTASWSAYISDGVATRAATFGQEPALRGRWVHLVVVVDREAQTMRLYTDGTPTGTIGLAGFGSVDNPNALQVGTLSYPIRGRIDEVRVYARALTAEWIATEHANVRDHAAFVVRGAEQPRP